MRVDRGRKSGCALSRAWALGFWLTCALAAIHSGRVSAQWPGEASDVDEPVAPAFQTQDPISAWSPPAPVVTTSQEFAEFTQDGEVAEFQPELSQDPLTGEMLSAGEPWTWQLLPSGLIYRSYLAGVKEPRIGTSWTYDRDGNAFWDTTLGGRAAIFRNGTTDTLHPEGWEWDIEGASLVRLDPKGFSTPVIGTDFRFGTLLTYGVGPMHTKFGYYHLSSHAGDEFLLANPTFERINYVRESLVWGLGYYYTPDTRVYGEVGYALSATGGAQPLEFQFGIDYSPAAPTTFRPVPFAAANCYLREDVGFGGNMVLQAGWQWRGANGGHLLRTGMEYFNGKSSQFEFFDQSEQRLGFGLWYDY